ELVLEFAFKARARLPWLARGTVYDPSHHASPSIADLVRDSDVRPAIDHDNSRPGRRDRLFPGVRLDRNVASSHSGCGHLHLSDYLHAYLRGQRECVGVGGKPDRKSTRLNFSHVAISYAVFCLKKKKRYTK